MTKKYFYCTLDLSNWKEKTAIFVPVILPETEYVKVR
jgi:hypothetical protein